MNPALAQIDQRRRESFSYVREIAKPHGLFLF
jgi:hypothetical protein